MHDKASIAKIDTLIEDIERFFVETRKTGGYTNELNERVAALANDYSWLTSGFAYSDRDVAPHYDPLKGYLVRTDAALLLVERPSFEVRLHRRTEKRRIDIANRWECVLLWPSVKSKNHRGRQYRSSG
jgi:oligoribonuclease (3'-5' exoribonuclease)